MRSVPVEARQRAYLKMALVCAKSRRNVYVVEKLQYDIGFGQPFISKYHAFIEWANCRTRGLDVFDTAPKPSANTGRFVYRTQ